MSLFPGFGINYKRPRAKWADDKAFFKSIKNPNTRFYIRPNLSYIPYPWTAGDPNVVGSYAYWRDCAAFFAADPDFYVTGGPGGLVGQTVGNLTQSMFDNYCASVVQEAQYCHNQGIAYGAFELDNEIERFNIGIQPYIRAGLRTLATTIKNAGYADWPLHHCMYNTLSGTNVAGWLSEDIGDVDILSLHCYASIANNVVSNNGFDFIVPLKNAFGSKFKISEFNLSTVPGALKNLPVPTMQAAYAQYLPLMKANTDMMIYYSFAGYLDGDDDFALLKQNGAMDEAWYLFFDSNPTQFTRRKASVNRGAAINRGASLNRGNSVVRRSIRGSL